VSSPMFNVAATKGISWSINQHKVEKDGETRVLYVCVECHTGERKCISSRYYAMQRGSHDEINETLVAAVGDAIKMFIGDNTLVERATPPASTLPKLMPQVPASNKPAPAETETEDEDDAEEVQPEPPRRGRGRPPSKPAQAPVEPKPRKDPKPPKVIVKYTLGDKTLSAALGTLLTELYGADFRKDVDLYERIKACRNDLIGIPMLADGVITEEFKHALKDAVGEPEGDEEVEF